MITIAFYKNAENNYTGFRLLGHAGYAQKGQDIVCAAVSVLVFNTINSIEAFTSDRFTLDMEEESGFIEFHIVSNISRESNLLLNSLALGFQGMKDEYEFIQLNL